jgi:hypothetical protein
MVMPQKQGFSERSKCFPRISRGKMPKLFELSNYHFLRFPTLSTNFQVKQLGFLLVSVSKFEMWREKKLFVPEAGELLRNPLRNLTFLSTYPREFNANLLQFNANLLQFNANLLQFNANLLQFNANPTQFADVQLLLIYVNRK